LAFLDGVGVCGGHQASGQKEGVEVAHDGRV
jgi:hypothetical protein